MKALLFERLKDTIVDYVFDYAYNEKVKYLQSGKLTLTVDSDNKLKNDGEIESLFDDVIKSGGDFNLMYDTRNKDYCKLIDNGIQSKFLDRLENIGIYRNKVKESDIENAVQFLCDKSYLVRNAPIKSEIKLSPKGLAHYEDGSSFEKKYFDRIMIRKANRKSTISILIAITAVVITVIIKLIDQYFSK